MMTERFVCIDVGYGDDWYITDNGRRLSEMEIVDLLNNLNDENEQLRQSVNYWQKKYEEGTETFQINKVTL